MIELREAALREQRILHALETHSVLSIPQLWEVPEVREVSSNQMRIRDTLRTLHRRGQILKLGREAWLGTSVVMWGSNGIQAGKTEPTEAKLEEPASLPPPVAQEQERRQVPTVHIENNRIIIEHPACRVIIDLLEITQ